MSEEKEPKAETQEQPEEHKTTLMPLVIAVGVAVLMAGVIFIPLFVAGLAIIIAALVKVFKDGKEEKFAEKKAPPEEKWPLENNKEKIGMWVFVMSEILIFGSLLSAYLYVRLNTPAWPAAAQTHNVILGMVNTIILLTSSLSIILALYFAKARNARGLKVGLVSTFALGLVFLIIKLVFEWPELISSGFTINSGLPGSTYYVLTGVHAAHVGAGLAAVGYLMFRAFGGGFTAEKHSGVENIGIYWHFVDIVWVFLFPLIYLI